MSEEKSPFILGAEVAVVRHHGFGGRSLSKAKIVKVTPTGRFAIEYSHGHRPDKMFQPKLKHYIGHWDWTAEIGGSKYSREHLEMWTEAHDAEVDNKVAAKDAYGVQKELTAQIGALNMNSPADRAKLMEIKALLD